MTSRLGSLFLLLMLVSGASAGVPLHSGQSNCGMSDMMDMDCCQKALLNELTPEVADAKLCCALNCAQEGMTSPPGTLRVMPPTVANTATPPAISQPWPNLELLFRQVDQLHGPPHAGPTYLRTLALLI